MRQHLNGPADPATLDELEQATGLRLPADFRASYLIHDGSATIPGLPYRVSRVIAGLPLLPLWDTRRAWEEWAGYAADTELFEDLSPDYRRSPEGPSRRRMRTAGGCRSPARRGTTPPSTSPRGREAPPGVIRGVPGGLRLQFDGLADEALAGS
jgi:cell wall assembly regulator SMI1